MYRMAHNLQDDGSLIPPEDICAFDQTPMTREVAGRKTLRKKGSGVRRAKIRTGEPELKAQLEDKSDADDDEWLHDERTPHVSIGDDAEEMLVELLLGYAEAIVTFPMPPAGVSVRHLSRRPACARGDDAKKVAKCQEEGRI